MCKGAALPHDTKYRNFWGNILPSWGLLFETWSWIKLTRFDANMARVLNLGFEVSKPRINPGLTSLSFHSITVASPIEF